MPPDLILVDTKGSSFETCTWFLGGAKAQVQYIFFLGGGSVEKRHLAKKEQEKGCVCTRPTQNLGLN